MAFAEPLTLADGLASPVNRDFFLIASDLEAGAKRVATYVTAPATLSHAIKHSVVGSVASGTRADRHLVQAVLTRLDTLNRPQPMIANLTLTVPQAFPAATQFADAKDLKAFVWNTIVTDALLTKLLTGQM